MLAFLRGMLAFLQVLHICTVLLNDSHAAFLLFNISVLDFRCVMLSLKMLELQFRFPVAGEGPSVADGYLSGHWVRRALFLLRMQKPSECYRARYNEISFVCCFSFKSLLYQDLH